MCDINAEKYREKDINARSFMENIVRKTLDGGCKDTSYHFLTVNEVSIPGA